MVYVLLARIGIGARLNGHVGLISFGRFVYLESVICLLKLQFLKYASLLGFVISVAFCSHMGLCDDHYICESHFISFFVLSE